MTAPLMSLAFPILNCQNDHWMNWILLILVVGNALLVVVQNYLNHLLSHDVTEAQTIRHERVKRNLRRVVVISAIVASVAAVISAISNHQKERRAEDSQSNLTGKVQSLTNDNKDLKKAVGDLMLAMASKPALDLSTRSEILEAKRKFDIGDTNGQDLDALVAAWSNKLARLQLKHEEDQVKNTEQQKESLTPSLPIWEYTIRKLQTILVGCTKPNGVTVQSDFTSLPSTDTLCEGYGGKPCAGCRDFDVCEISLSTNSAWNCKCSIRIPDRTGIGGGPARLGIVCNSKNRSDRLWVFIEYGTLITELHTIDCDDCLERNPVSEYTNSVDAALDGLIAAQAGELATIRK